MQLADYDYHLPEELIAQEALADRAASRMLVVYRDQGRWEDRYFREFPSFLRAGDCLVLNDSRVFPARLFGTRAGVNALPLGKNNPKLREHLSANGRTIIEVRTERDANVALHRRLNAAVAERFA